MSLWTTGPIWTGILSPTVLFLSIVFFGRLYLYLIVVVGLEDFFSNENV